MPPHQARQQALLLAREAGHIRVFEQIRTVCVVAGVRDIEANFVQPGSPFQGQLGKRLVELPSVAHFSQKVQHGLLDALSLRQIDVIARLHGAHAALACVFVGETPDHVVQQPVAHCAVSNLHALDAQHFKNFGQNRDTAWKHRATLVCHCSEWNVFDMSCRHHGIEHQLQTARRNRRFVR